MTEPSPRNLRARRARIARWATVVAACVVAVVASLLAWRPRPVPVEIVVVALGPLEVTVLEDGRARVKDRYLVSAPLAGRMARLERHAGDEVKRGEVLTRLLPVDAPLLDPRTQTTAEARVRVAQAAVSQARSTLARVEAADAFAAKERGRLAGLASSGAVAPEQLDRAELEARSAREAAASARFGVQVAEHELRMAEAALGRSGRGAGAEQLDMPSPIDGRILRVVTESEGVVTPGQPLLEVGDPAALEIVVDVLTADAVRVRPGAAARVHGWGGPALAAHVRSVEPSAFTKLSALGVEEQRVNVIVDLDSPRSEWSALGDGYRVDVEIVTWQSPQTLTVPTTALVREGDRWWVYVESDGSASRRAVEVGERGSLRAEVRGGLQAGDRVIDHPSDRLHEGARVEVTTPGAR